MYKIKEDRRNRVDDLRNVARFQNNASPSDVDVPSLLRCPEAEGSTPFTFRNRDGDRLKV